MSFSVEPTSSSGSPSVPAAQVQEQRVPTLSHLSSDVVSEVYVKLWEIAMNELNAEFYLTIVTLNVMMTDEPTVDEDIIQLARVLAPFI